MDMNNTHIEVKVNVPCHKSFEESERVVSQPWYTKYSSRRYHIGNILHC